ncbi:MAG: hypothetical protein HYY16_06830 [Planctomycetes bacterium]|nr:hypothetical protein [Planctomycetota bacterium]
MMKTLIRATWAIVLGGCAATVGGTNSVPEVIDAWLAAARRSDAAEMRRLEATLASKEKTTVWGAIDAKLSVLESELGKWRNRETMIEVQQQEVDEAHLAEVRAEVARREGDLDALQGLRERLSK